MIVASDADLMTGREAAYPHRKAAKHQKTYRSVQRRSITIWLSIDALQEVSKHSSQHSREEEFTETSSTSTEDWESVKAHRDMLVRDLVRAQLGSAHVLATDVERSGSESANTTPLASAPRQGATTQYLLKATVAADILAWVNRLDPQPPIQLAMPSQVADDILRAPQADAEGEQKSARQVDPALDAEDRAAVNVAEELPLPEGFSEDQSMAMRQAPLGDEEHSHRFLNELDLVKDIIRRAGEVQSSEVSFRDQVHMAVKTNKEILRIMWHIPRKFGDDTPGTFRTDALVLLVEILEQLMGADHLDLPNVLYKSFKPQTASKYIRVPFERVMQGMSNRRAIRSVSRRTEHGKSIYRRVKDLKKAESYDFADLDGTIAFLKR